MLTLGCLVAGCKEQVANTVKDVAIALFNGHASTHTGDTNCNQGSSRNKIVIWSRPKITQGMSANSWRSLQVLWSLYKMYTDVGGDDTREVSQACSETGDMNKTTSQDV